MAQPPPRGGLSLYANLLDPKDAASSSATISSAPVVYDQNKPVENETGPKKHVDPALRFQPIRRPQTKQQPGKPKASFPKAIPKTIASEAPPNTTAATGLTPVTKTLADWAATEEDEWMYGTGEKRQRGGRKRKKKRQDIVAETDWDDLYDPSRPTNVDEFLKSDEKIDEIREWKDLLYHHRTRTTQSDLSDGEDDEEETRPLPSNRFPPPSFNAYAPPPPSPPTTLPDDNIADGASSGRMDLTQGQRISESPPPMIGSSAPPKPPADSAVISRAPIVYEQTSKTEGSQDDQDMDDEEYPAGLGSSNQMQDEPSRSSRPGQFGFAQRLMSKYGWTQGTGLGADESGIINPLRVQVEKRRKKADADGGGWAEPAGKGKIIGGKRKNENESKFGAMSEVVVLQQMLENMPDLQTEISNGLAQEIGEECGEKYGRVERLYIDQPTRQVFIKFTNQVSALRAVDALAGRVFNGNEIKPKFFDVEKFEKGDYS